MDTKQRSVASTTKHQGSYYYSEGKIIRELIRPLLENTGGN